MAYICWTSVLALLLSICYIVCNCPDGWMRHRSTCYHFSHDKEDWTGAMEVCKFFGGQLVEINDATEQAYLGAQAKLLNRDYWIALSDLAEEGSWVWMNSKDPVTYTNWNPGQPDNSVGNENCAELWHTTTWNDAQCNSNGLHYICELADEGNAEIVG